MTDAERTLLTWVCLVAVAYGSWSFLQAERLADRTYVKIGGADRRIRGRIIRGKRFVVGMGVCLFLTIQNLLFDDVWDDWGLRPFFFTAAIVCYMIAGADIRAGYAAWNRDMNLFLGGFDDDEEEC